MTIQERLDFLDRCSFAVTSVAASSLPSVRRSVGEAGVDDLLRVGIVLSELLHRPSEGDLLRKSAFGKLVADSHHIIVMTAATELDFGFRQLGRNEGVEVGLDALYLLVFLALLGIGSSGGGDFFRRERNDLGFRSEKNVGVVGKTAQSGDVLALHIRLGSQKFLVIGIAGIKRLLVVCLELLHFFLILGNSRKLRGYLIGEDNTESVAAHRDVAHQRMRIGNDLRLQLTKSIGIICAIYAICGENMVEVHERHTRELSDVASALSSLEEARHSKELAFVFESLTTGLAIRPGEYSQLLIATDEVGDSFKKPRQGQLAGHVMENAYVHKYQSLVV